MAVLSEANPMEIQSLPFAVPLMFVLVMFSILLLSYTPARKRAKQPTFFIPVINVGLSSELLYRNPIPSAYPTMPIKVESSYPGPYTHC